jgi:hypothetical protein
MAKQSLYIALALFVPLTLASSCASKESTPQPPSQDEIIAEGSRFFSEGKLAEATGAWSAINDTEKKSEYLDFIQAYADFDLAVAKAEAQLAATKLEEALQAATSLGEPPSPPPAVDLPDPRDTRTRIQRVGDEAGKAIAARAAAAESDADGLLATAKARAAKGSAETAEKAKEGFEAAAKLFENASGWVPEADSSAARAQDKASAAESLHKALLKETLLSFTERMGEIFARTPDASKKLGDKELLAFNAETSALIQGGLSEFNDIVAAYPDILDSSTLDKLRESTRGLSSRFARMESLIKAVKDRGKPVMPLIIGIFNPQPGDPQRSRPASFSGASSKASDWWWGIADIPKGTAQDLVITMSDPRMIRVYSVGKGSGAARAVPDLVNPLFKVGNSWPVLNAGERLDNGVFHIEVGPGQGATYSGEAVVYKSFITRTR